MTDLPTFVLERTFDAPQELVWRTWTEPDLVSRWYGPNVETIVHRLDPRPGGLWLIEMRTGTGQYRQRAEYTVVDPPERLECLLSSADGDWNITASPMMADWPRVLLTTVTLSDNAGRTDLRLTWTPHEATEAEIACFAAAMEGMGSGWGAGMELLAELLRELRV
jgi:uncharacterized protein YndB with AHSA1/START domain